MKVLIFGAGGMIGHRMFIELSKKHQVIATLKSDLERYEKFKLFDSSNTFERVDVADFVSVQRLLSEQKPDVILNCVGITLRKPEIKDEEYCKKINTDFPHLLKKWADEGSKYLIHFSTDCVFSGKEGPYDENSPKTAQDVYGRTKAAGEVSSSHCLTLRGSMIGRELFGKTELLEWALSSRNQKVKGYSRAIYSGVTTHVMAKLVEQLIGQENPLTGLYQVSGEPISKYALLQKIDRHFSLNMVIAEETGYATSKVLLSDKIKARAGFVCPNWDDMLDQVAKDDFNQYY
jgi:dTDP-4-dehydrorhamnose reductase